VLHPTHFAAATVSVSTFVVGVQDSDDFYEPRGESTVYSPTLVEEAYCEVRQKSFKKYCIWVMRCRSMLATVVALVNTTGLTGLALLRKGKEIWP
jgi:hypothetical protein